ncbi:BrnT family toxin [Aminobacter sp. DSM 101952]|uniref:BrnT family toxin n=1 Tax=Aminobacter sp. DSM 101952 TaxID=2735891 RepID=UPI001FCCE281|nr:BrnT family toxin [Aminobacter sp. DSM 101952]
MTFDEAAVAIVQPHLERESNRQGELRVLAICPSSRRIIAVVYTMRGQKCRIISARAARDNEQRTYRFLFP